MSSTPQTWKITPWRDRPIAIVGVELTKIDGGPTLWWMAGKANPEGDAMMFLGPGENHGRHDFPAGFGMSMPDKEHAGPRDYVDLHGSCSGGGPVHVFYVLYFVEQ